MLDSSGGKVCKVRRDSKVLGTVHEALRSSDAITLDMFLRKEGHWNEHSADIEKRLARCLWSKHSRHKTKDEVG